MAGQGPGTYERWNKRQTTTSANPIDIRQWHRCGYLVPGGPLSARWYRGDVEVGSISGYVASLTRIVLEYQSRSRSSDEWSDVVESIEVEWTPCTFGGTRPWFRCPICERRVAVLYLPRSYCACRQCHRLAYPSTRETPHDRLLSKAEAIRQRLGGTSNIVSPFPTRPSGMQHRTYGRLRQKAETYERAALEQVQEYLGTRFSSIMENCD